MQPPSPNNGLGFLGFQPPSTFGSEFNSQVFLIWSILARISTATLVRVEGVTNTGALEAVGFVDVLPLINQVDGANNATPHRTIYGLPYFRIQGGSDAIILDPKVGDVGIVIFADRDISSAKVNKAPSSPGSKRRFDMADGLYIGGVLNAVPQQYIQFSAAGISVVSPTEVDISAPVVRIHASTSLHIDADGNGTVYTSANREDYIIGSSGHASPINPPQVP